MHPIIAHSPRWQQASFITIFSAANVLLQTIVLGFMGHSTHFAENLLWRRDNHTALIYANESGAREKRKGSRGTEKERRGGTGAERKRYVLSGILRRRGK